MSNTKNVAYISMCNNMQPMQYSHCVGNAVHVYAHSPLSRTAVSPQGPLRLALSGTKRDCPSWPSCSVVARRREPDLVSPVQAVISRSLLAEGLLPTANREKTLATAGRSPAASNAMEAAHTTGRRTIMQPLYTEQGEERLQQTRDSRRASSTHRAEGYCPVSPSHARFNKDGTPEETELVYISPKSQLCDRGCCTL